MLDRVLQFVALGPAERRVVDPQNDAVYFLVVGRLVEPRHDLRERFGGISEQAQRFGTFRIRPFELNLSEVDRVGARFGGPLSAGARIRRRGADHNSTDRESDGPRGAHEQNLPGRKANRNQTLAGEAASQPPASSRRTPLTAI